MSQPPSSTLVTRCDEAHSNGCGGQVSTVRRTSRETSLPSVSIRSQARTSWRVIRAAAATVVIRTGPGVDAPGHLGAAHIVTAQGFGKARSGVCCAARSAVSSTSEGMDRRHPVPQVCEILLNFAGQLEQRSQRLVRKPRLAAWARRSSICTTADSSPATRHSREATGQLLGASLEEPSECGITTTATRPPTRTRTGTSTLRHLDLRGAPQPVREQASQTSVVPWRVRITFGSDNEGVLRPETSPWQEAQYGDHPPSPPPRRRPPRMLKHGTIHETRNNQLPLDELHGDTPEGITTDTRSDRRHRTAASTACT